MEPVSSRLDLALAGAADRLRLHVFAVNALWASILSSAAGLAAVLLGRYDLLSLPPWAVIALAYALAAGFGVGRALMLPLSTMDVARLADERLGLKERLSSSIAFAGAGGIDPAFHALQRRDADEAADRVAAGNLTAPRRLRIAALCALLAAVLLTLFALLCALLPNAIATPHWNARATRVGRTLGDRFTAAARILPPATEAAPLARDGVQTAREIRDLPPEQARRKVQRLSDRVEQHENELSPDRPMKNESEFQRAMDRALGSGGAAQGQGRQNGDSSDSGNDGRAEDLSGTLRSLADKIERGEPSQSAGETARRLNQIDRSLEGAGMPQTQERVRNASRALQDGDSAKAARDLRAASEAAQREAPDAEGTRRMRSAVDQAARELEQGAQDAKGRDGGGSGKDGTGQPASRGRNRGSAGEPKAMSGAAQGRPGQGEDAAGGQSGNGKGPSSGPGVDRPSSARGEGSVERDAGNDIPTSAAPRRIGGYDPRQSTGRDRLASPPAGAGVSREAGPGISPLPAGPSVVPYGRDQAAARKTAESAIGRQNIPPAYKRAVESYFRGEPGSRP
ncbi:MAG: hypothetical protein P4L33_13715 [Capsulimonadaceae bacterium]|nr:hypothetical protein [Capsulimonadaceae bacterium]